MGYQLPCRNKYNKSVNTVSVQMHNFTLLYVIVIEGSAINSLKQC